MSTYPGGIFEPRAKENKEGVIYDPALKTIGFAEDVVGLDDEVVAVETELGLNPKDNYASVASFLATIKTRMGGTLNRQRMVVGVTDFLLATNQGGFPTWIGAGFGTTVGTTGAQAAVAGHPGIVFLSSSVAADSGYYFATSPTSFLLAGGETTVIVFKTKDISANTFIRLGFQDNLTVAALIDGVWINIAGATLDGRTSSNSISSTTATSYTVTDETWYRMRITLNSNATLATYELYSEAGVLLWTDTLSTNIPTSAGRDVGHGVTVRSSGTAALGLINLDYMALFIDRVLIR